MILQSKIMKKQYKTPNDWYSNNTFELLTSIYEIITNTLVARLYGLRISERKTERLIKELKNDKKINCES